MYISLESITISKTNGCAFESNKQKPAGLAGSLFCSHRLLQKRLTALEFDGRITIVEYQ